MNNKIENKKFNKARILIFAQRNIYSPVHFRCYLAEFEDLICQMDSVNMLSPQPNRWFKYGTRIAQRLAVDYAISFNPGIPICNMIRHIGVKPYSKSQGLSLCKDCWKEKNNWKIFPN